MKELLYFIVIYRYIIPRVLSSFLFSDKFRLRHEAEGFVKRHKASYNKFSRKNKDVTPVDFLLRERSMLEKRLVKALKNRL